MQTNLFHLLGVGKCGFFCPEKCARKDFCNNVLEPFMRMPKVVGEDGGGGGKGRKRNTTSLKVEEEKSVKHRCGGT